MMRTLAAIVAALVATSASAQDKKPENCTYVIGDKSQISLNGRAWVDFTNARASAGGMGGKAAQNLSRFSSQASYFRVAGKRDFAPGWSLVAQFEAEVAIDGEAGTPFSSTRNTYGGVKSPYGQLQIGKYDSPSKNLTLPRDPFGGTTMFGYYSVFNGYRADRRPNNAIMYTSPEIEGLSFQALFSMGEAKFAGTTAGSPTGQRVDPWMGNAAVFYKFKLPTGPAFAGVSYEYKNDCGNPDADAPNGPSCNIAALGTADAPNGVDQTIRFGADATISQTFTKVSFVYDYLDQLRPAKYGQAKLSRTRSTYWGSITQGIMGNKHQLILSGGGSERYKITNATFSGTQQGTQVSVVTAAYRYNIDSNAQVYLGWTQVSNGKNIKQSFGTGGPSALQANGWAVPNGSTVTGFGSGFIFVF